MVKIFVGNNFAFVHMQREKDANDAISKLNHSVLEGQKIIVSISRNNQARNGRRDDYPVPYHPYSPYPPHAHYLPPQAPLVDYYAPCGRLPHPPLPPPPPRAYYEHDLYERSYYERDPYELLPPPLPQQSLTPPVPSRYYRERSPLASQRNLVPPPSSASYTQSGDVGDGTPPSSLGYAVGSGFDKDDCFEESYSNGFVRGY
ncbi:hypothetical protein DPEC_G00240410 [Dallia pectoralis]|uniref:Uncharacterized protein n=1 Tax=Dallia pectoralis TaxID=75939 RepID=A0ACC2FZU1_DALPE|nr:hypothetical protein DPEC_G00240410 [Dallia pectoralis]